MKKVALISADQCIHQCIRLCLPQGIDVQHLSRVEDIHYQMKFHNFSLVIIDTDSHYDELLIQWKQYSALSLPIIALTSVEGCARLFQIPGAIINDVIQKPLSKTACRKIIAKHIIGIAAIRQKNRENDTELDSIMIGNSQSMKKVKQTILKFAKSNEPILIYGESGTGKEVAAKCIAACSSSERLRLYPQHLGAIPENLIETTLFGCVSGAFTGAKNMDGLFSSCGQGTIFLDEIGEINQACQIKLLRVLESGEFSKVGSSSMHKTKARVICATNRNLEKAVEEGSFRLDLYHRINVLKIEIPPLRERREDIFTLTSYFLSLLNKTISYSALSYLAEQKWPGNARELYNVLKRASVLCEGDQLQMKDITV